MSNSLVLYPYELLFTSYGILLSYNAISQLERFLISNRDEYLKYSNKNYTAEQKQYNNWLTERLLEVADQHHFVFDSEDFNFVAVRDRIRCYYKSYVQTARKRGILSPAPPQTTTGGTSSSSGKKATKDKTKTKGEPLAKKPKLKDKQEKQIETAKRGKETQPEEEEADRVTTKNIKLKGKEEGNETDPVKAK